MPEFFGPFSRTAFLVNTKSLFLQKCQCIELLTVFRLHIYSIIYSIYSIFSSKLTFKSWISTSEKRGPSCLNSGHGGGGFRGFGQCPKKNVFFRWPLPLVLSSNSVKGGRSEGGDILRRSFLAAQEKSFIHLKGGEGGKVMMRKHARLKKPFVQYWAYTFFIKVLLLGPKRYAS